MLFAHPGCAGMAALPAVPTAAPLGPACRGISWAGTGSPLQEEAPAQSLSRLTQCCQSDAPVASARPELCAGSDASQVFTSKLGISFPSLLALSLAFLAPSISIMSLDPF